MKFKTTAKEMKKGGVIMVKFTAADLRAAVQNTGSNFFDSKTMRFFGDTMKNYGVRETTVKTNWSAADVYTADGVIIPVYELYRRRPVKHGLWSSAYFDVKTFKRVYPADK
jgi:hypothetical protein